MHSGFLAAPDIKVTEVDHTTSALAGGYAGWLADETFFIGGGAYWLANPDSDRRMAYGGLVLLLGWGGTFSAAVITWAFAQGDRLAEALLYVPMPDNVVGAIQRLWAAEIRDAGGKSLLARPN